MSSYTQLIQTITAENEPLLQRFDPTAAIKLFDGFDKHLPFHHVSPQLRQMWDGIDSEFGAAGFGAFQKLVMLHLMNAFKARAQNVHYVDQVLKYFERSFARITNNIENPEHSDYNKPNDLLLKDLALCRQKLFPAGPQAVEADSGFHRALMFRKGIKQALSFINLLRKTGGNTGYYQYHTHLSEMGEFNAEGFDHFYLIMADMLKVNPDVKGIWGGSWFFDPHMDEVSPRLSYLRTRQVENGASIFYSEVSIDSGALATSRTRQKLYAEGSYMPTSYCIIWPRKELIAWSETFRADKQ